jgi:hypothetical protein
MSRADRRRQLRQAGAHRSPSKKGRRAPIRAASNPVEKSEVVISGGLKITLPTPAEIAAVSDPSGFERVRRG